MEQVEKSTKQIITAYKPRKKMQVISKTSMVLTKLNIETCLQKGEIEPFVRINKRNTGHQTYWEVLTESSGLSPDGVLMAMIEDVGRLSPFISSSEV